jgi:tetratricopeptide (TPR) repeat protein
MPRFIRVFISYSSQDQLLAARLAADLQARNYLVWLDRERLIGGQQWVEAIKRAIQLADVVVLCISPDSMTSRYVRFEYEYALEEDKIILPVLLRKTDNVFSGLEQLHYVSFDPTVVPYPAGLNHLLLALSQDHIWNKKREPARKSRAEAQLRDTPIELVPAANLQAQQPDIALNELYRLALQAENKGDLERAASLYEKITQDAMFFRNGLALKKLEDLNQRLIPRRLASYNEFAETAFNQGQYDRAITAWQSFLDLYREYDDCVENVRRMRLLGIIPYGSKKRRQSKSMAVRAALQQPFPASIVPDEIAQRIRLAQTNIQQIQLYNDAQYFLAEGQKSIARQELERLWEQAPFFVDTEKLARQAGVRRRKRSLVPLRQHIKREARRQKRQQYVANGMNGLYILAVLIVGSCAICGSFQMGLEASTMTFGIAALLLFAVLWLFILLGIAQTDLPEKEC